MSQELSAVMAYLTGWATSRLFTVPGSMCGNIFQPVIVSGFVTQSLGMSATVMNGIHSRSQSARSRHTSS